MEIKHNQIAWLNLANPGIKDLNFLGEELNIEQSALRDLLGSNMRPKIEEFGSYLFLVFHFPVWHEKNLQTIPTELDFIVTSENVITVWQNTNPCLEQIFDELKNNETLRQNNFRSAAYLLFYILDRLIDSCLPMLDHIHEKIETIEQQVFEGKEREMLKEIAIVKRDIIDFRRTLKPQRSVLELLAKKADRFFKENLELIGQEVISSEIRVWNILENHKEMIEAIEKTNEGLLSYQINRVMHILTFFSIILFSLTFITSFFSMQLFNRFAIDQSLWIWIISGFMLADVVLITVLFKRKKWM